MEYKEEINRNSPAQYGEGRSLDVVYSLISKIEDEENKFLSNIRLFNKIDLKDIDYNKINISEKEYDYLMSKLEEVFFICNIPGIYSIRTLVDYKPLKNNIRFLLPLFDLVEHLQQIQLIAYYNHSYGGAMIYFSISFKSSVYSKIKAHSLSCKILGDRFHTTEDMPEIEEYMTNKLLDKLLSVSFYHMDEDKVENDIKFSLTLYKGGEDCFEKINI